MMDKKDSIFLEKTVLGSSFTFNDEVVDVFDDMITRSVPLYVEQQAMLKDIVKKFYVPNTNIYDLGCSTATMLINLCSEIKDVDKFIGYDNSFSMIEEAQQRIKTVGFEDRIEIRYGDFNEELSTLSLENASIVIMCWTLQFVRPLRREKLVKWVSNNLVENGVLLIAEKVLTNDSEVNAFYIDFYYDFKKKNGYSQTEISRKREALENVLVPYTANENIEMIKQNGFKNVETFFRWFNWCGFLCLK